MSNPLPTDFLNAAGLNRQHVFALDDLSAEIRESLGDCRGFRQLILLGHGGRLLWEQVKADGLCGDNPIDDYVVATVNRNFRDISPMPAYRIIYPSPQMIGLQALGKLAGWHQPSPFMVGIDPEWGSWYAYRAVVLSDTDFSPTPFVERANPCADCQDQPCLTACPPGALADGKFALDICSTWRRQDRSPCRHSCLARLACPVGTEHRYSAEQMKHSYAISLRFIK